MLNKLSLFIKTNFSIISAFFVLTLISIINSFTHIGLIEDGVHHFWEALTSGNIWIGHEGFSYFPYNSRFFPSILPHLGTGLAIKFGILDISSLLFIFTFISYLSPMIFLGIIYLNLPKGKKEYFDIILLSFLICITFMIYQIWTENLITGLFLWIIFAVYFYCDFNKLSYLNIFSLIVFPVALISSHPMVVVFIPILLFIGIKKYINTVHKKLNVKIILTYSFIILTIAFVFNLYFILHPIFNATTEYLQGGVFYSAKMIRLSLSILLILFIATAKNIKNKKVYNFAYLIIAVNIIDNIIFNIPSSDGYIYRTVGFYSVLFFMIVLIIFRYIKYIAYIKITNTLFLILLLVNCLNYTKIWDRYLSNINAYFIEKRQITVLYDSNLNVFTSQPVFFQVYHYHLHPFVLILMPELFEHSQNAKLTVNIISSSEKLIQFYNKNLTERTSILKKFGINIDESVKIDYQNEKS